VSAFSHMIISFFFQRFHIKISVRKNTESLQISRRERLNESNNENLSRETDTFSVRIWIRESHRECKPRVPPGRTIQTKFSGLKIEDIPKQNMQQCAAKFAAPDFPI
jgi:hypothetical protein